MTDVCSPSAVAEINLIVPAQTVYSNKNGDLPNITVRWAKNVDDLESLVDEWNALADQALRKNPAFEPNYLIPALKHLGDPAVKVVLVEGIYPNGSKELVGLMPMRSNRPFGLPLSAIEIWKHKHCFDSTPLLSRRFATLVWEQVCLFLLDQRFGLLLLDTVSAEPEFEQVFNTVSKRLGQTTFEKNRFQRAAYEPVGSPEAYTKEFVSKKLRQNLRRLNRRLAETGRVSFEISNSSSDYNSLARDFMMLEASGWKGRDGTAISSNLQIKRFYEELIVRSSREGKARFVTLSLDSKPIAMLSDIRSGDFVYSYKTAFDESYSQFSPGLQVEQKNIEFLHDEGISLADSCTSADNSAINRIWGQKLQFQTKVVALRSGIPRLVTRTLPALQTIVRKIKR